MKKGMFYSSFWKRKPVSMDDKGNLIRNMMRIMTEKVDDVLTELLFMCVPYFDNGILSVVLNEDRQIIASTEKAAYLPQIQNVAQRIKEPEKEYYYLKEEKNGLFFRNGINCIRVYPIKDITRKKCFVMVEQAKNVDLSFDSMMDVLAVAAKIKLQEDMGKELKKKDVLTGMKNRDALVDMLNEVNLGDSENYLGMFFVFNMHLINQREGMTRADGYLKRMASIISSYFPKQTYRISGSKFCVWEKRTIYDVASNLQDCLEELRADMQDLDIGCVVAAGTDEVYKSLYMCESVARKGAKDAVIVVREPVEELEMPMQEQLYYIGVKENVQEENFYEEVSSFDKDRRGPEDDISGGTDKEKKTEEKGIFGEDFFDMDTFFKL